MSEIYISDSAGEALRKYLRMQGHAINTVKGYPGLDTPIASHPDIYMCKLGNTIFHGNPERLSSGYPGDSIYNGCSTGKFFIHNFKITYPGLLALAEKEDHIMVDVAQGYAKCSCVVVDEDSVITADKGIEKAAKKAGMDILLIGSGHVALEGYKYGFLGGASGRVGNEIIFNGDLSAHPDYREIRRFIEERGLKTVYFPEYPLTDIGSLIEDAHL